ncbi:MAG: TIGR00730 family Rossman fold protein [Candidatus Obscuribacterales bacterium]|nr:TIGR00730 family Rossman fold protein [Candidatus Obscuribacterales bacterium]
MGSLTSGQEKLLDAGRTPATDFAENARDALLFSLIQTPLSGATQLVDKMIQTPLSGATHLADKTVGTDLMAKTQIFSAPKQAEFGTSAWLGQVTGSTLGTALPFIALHRMMGPGAAAKLEITNNYGLCRAAMPALGKSMLVGGAYAAVLQPVNEKEEGNFWLARGRNAATGSLVGLTLTATAIGLKSTGVRALNHDIVAGGLSGIPAGLVSANSHSLLSGKGLATGKENFQAVATFSLGGAFLGGTNMVHEYVRPTSGIRGVRTLEDVAREADKTRSPNFEQRNAMMLASEIEGRPYAALPGKPGKPNRLYEDVMASLAESTLDPKMKELIATSHVDLVTSLEAIKDTGYRVTIYGSARIGPERFEYQRCRWLAGMLGRDGVTTMTGGGVDIHVRRGIMDAANRGGFEAGGQSIGVSIKLPFEGGANPFQTTKLMHQNYNPRKEVLRKANAFVVEEGGLGTVDEAMELLCHLQCRKQDGAPVFFVGKATYGPLVKALENLVSRKLMSPDDMKLFKVVEDPRQIHREIMQHKAQWEAAQQSSVTGGIRVTFPSISPGVAGLNPGG